MGTCEYHVERLEVSCCISCYHEVNQVEQEGVQHRLRKLNDRCFAAEQSWYEAAENTAKAMICYSVVTDILLQQNNRFLFIL